MIANSFWRVMAFGLTVTALMQGVAAHADQDSETMPEKRVLQTVEAAEARQAEAVSSGGHTSGGGGGKTTNNGIIYHGGPVLLGTTNVYYIWYGNWTGNSAQSILPFLAEHIGGSPYFNINTTYFNGSGTAVSNSVSYKGAINDNYSFGPSLTDLNVEQIVANAIAGTDPTHQSGTLPYDTNGVYFVLASADVAETSGFCTTYCGWHNYYPINGGNIQFAFIGNADRCPTACSAQTVSPNGNVGADAMASIIAHELEESVTDPLLNAWYDSTGKENADKCAWNFGTTTTLSDGARYNMVLGNSTTSKEFLIQENWVNSRGGYCAISH